MTIQTVDKVALNDILSAIKTFLTHQIDKETALGIIRSKPELNIKKHLAVHVENNLRKKYDINDEFKPTYYNKGAVDIALWYKGDINRRAYPSISVELKHKDSGQNFGEGDIGKDIDKRQFPVVSAHFYSSFEGVEVSGHNDEKADLEFINLSLCNYSRIDQLNEFMTTVNSTIGVARRMVDADHVGNFKKTFRDYLQTNPDVSGEILSSPSVDVEVFLKGGVKLTITYKLYCAVYYR